MAKLECDQAIVRGGEEIARLLAMERSYQSIDANSPQHRDSKSSREVSGFLAEEEAKVAVPPERFVTRCYENRQAIESAV